MTSPIDVMRQITDTTEAAANSTIVGWARRIGEIYPDMASYCAQYTSSTIAWCGLTVAYCMATNGIRPVFGSTDVDKFLYALAWRQFGTQASSPQAGDVLVFDWGDGSHHVTLYEQTQGGSYICRGGNQSDSVKLSTFPISRCIAIRRPPVATSVPVAPVIPVSQHSSITCTVFGGASDFNTSAYDAHVITNTELGCALPYRFTGTRPKVRVWKDSHSVVVDIVDVGPWNTNDPYWQTNSRPQAESGTDTRGRHTNLAGIDLTPAAAKVIGVDGKGLVSWEFVDTAQKEPPPVATAPSIDINALMAALLPQIQALVQQAVVQAVANATPAPAPAPIPVIVAAAPPVAVPTAPVQITVGSTIAHIQPVLDMINPILATLLPPPWNLVPQGLGALSHLISGAAGGAPMTPASVGSSLDTGLQAVLPVLHASGINLPPWLANVAAAIQAAHDARSAPAASK